MKNMKDILFIIILTLLIAVMIVMNIFLQGFGYYIAMISSALFASILIWGKYLKNKNKWLYLLNFLILYLMLIISVFVYRQFIEYKLNQFDVNGDSIFSKEEQTVEQIKYMEIWANSLGRSLIYFTGIIISLVSTFFLFIIVRLFNIFKRK